MPGRLAATMDDLPTPALLLERARLEANIEYMRGRARRLGVRLRPNMKTAKCIEVARMVLEPGEGITVSTLAEAEYFARHGIRDILYAVGFEPGKARRAAALTAAGVDLQVIVDSVEMAGWIADSGLAVGVWLEIDSDGTRCGFDPRDERVIAAAGRLGGSFRGVMTHAGGSYACHGPEEIAVAAENERLAVTTAAAHLRAAGVEAAGVGVGSTPTATFATTLDGVTEMRPGVFVFQDLYQVGLGVCTVAGIAVSVLAAVIGHRSGGEAVIDAGALALSLDRSTARQDLDQGFGAVCDQGGEPLGGMYVRSVTQEHGILAHRGGPIDLDRFPVGRRLRILPNHACMTAAAHDRYRVVLDGEIIDTWHRHNGW